MVWRHCSLCNFRCFTEQTLLKHIRFCHQNDPNFMIYCSECGVSFKRWESLRKHLLRTEHAATTVSLDINNTVDGDTGLVDADEIYHSECSSPSSSTQRQTSSEWDMAHFLMKATDELDLTHSGVERLCDSVKWLVNVMATKRAERMKTILSNSDLSPDTYTNIITACYDCPDELDKLSNRQYRESFHMENFHYVKPELVCLGEEWDWRNGHNNEKHLTKIEQYGYYIDLFSTIKAILNNPALREECLTSHNSSDGVLRDFCDAETYKNHPVFSVHKNALGFIIYYDDIEVANPLGSRAGTHKLGCFYFTLANIRPVYRSKLKSIFLFAVAKTEYLRTFGCDALLTKFVKQMNQLSQGYDIQLMNEETIITVFGGVLCVTGDTPASNFLSGFKEGVGFALRKCRMCMATQSDMSTKFNINLFNLRTLRKHMDYLELVEEERETKKQYHSTTSGINGRSSLLTLIGFDVTKCLPYDVMHTVFEGVAVTHLKLLFNYLIEDKGYLTLEQLNLAIRNHKYGYSEVHTKPSQIGKDSTGFRVKQSASQMMTLVRLIPLLLGPYVDEDDCHWECFRVLWVMCDIVCTYEVHQDDPQHLAWIVQMYLELFTMLYPDVNVTPKMHYLLHLATQMICYGPLRHHWCMRFESKNAQMKSFVTNCFKNVPLSVAIRHQQWLCYQLLVHPSQSVSGYLYEGDEIKSAQPYDLSISPYKEQIHYILDSLPNAAYCTNCVTIHGIQYKSESVIRVKSDDEFEKFHYAMIEDILIIEDLKIFVTEKLYIDKVNAHLCSLEVSKTSNHQLVTFNSFFCHGVLHLKDTKYLVEKDNNFKNLWCYLI